MKLLTGKCRTEFEKYIDSLDVAPYVSMLDNIPSTYLNTLIIDFFDSVGIYIEVKIYVDWFYFDIINEFRNYEFTSWKGFETRQQAIEEAIKKANEIFNNR